MKIKIKNLDPTGVVVEAKEIELPIVLDRTEENGYKEEVQPDGTVHHYEPARQNRYFMESGRFVYRINEETGELTFYSKDKRKNLD